MTAFRRGGSWLIAVLWHAQKVSKAPCSAASHWLDAAQLMPGLSLTCRLHQAVLHQKDPCLPDLQLATSTTLWYLMLAPLESCGPVMRHRWRRWALWCSRKPSCSAIGAPIAAVNNADVWKVSDPQAIAQRP